MRLGNSTWVKVDDYLKGTKTLLIPVGSTEQHGPTALIGTDYMTAEAIASEIGEHLGLFVAPSQNYGMANHHLGFPGSASLNPLTYIQVQLDLLDSWYEQGFRNFVYINGHGGNIAPLNTAFSQFKRKPNKAKIAVFSWWHLPEVLAYEKEHFGDENGHHATCGEVSVTQYLHPEAFKDIKSQNFKVSPSNHHWPLSPSEMKELYPDGRMDSNPGLANAEHGEKLFRIAVETLCLKLKEWNYA